MAVFLRRNRIILLFVICLGIYFIFSLLIIGKSVEKTQNEQDDVQLPVLDDLDSDINNDGLFDIPGDYDFEINNDDLFITEELLNIGNIVDRFMKPLHPQKYDDIAPNVHLNDGKIFIYPKTVTVLENNPDVAFDAMELKKFDNPVVTFPKKQFSNFNINKSFAVVAPINEEPTMYPRNPDVEEFPEFKPDKKKQFPTTKRVIKITKRHSMTPTNPPHHPDFEDKPELKEVNDIKQTTSTMKVTKEKKPIFLTPTIPPQDSDSTGIPEFNQIDKLPSPTKLVKVTKPDILHPTVPPQHPDSKGMIQLKNINKLGPTAKMIKVTKHVRISTIPAQFHDSKAKPEFNLANKVTKLLATGIPKTKAMKQTKSQSKPTTFLVHHLDSKELMLLKNKKQPILKKKIGTAKFINPQSNVSTIQDTDIGEYKEMKTFTKGTVKPTKNPSLIIDTQGCKIPKLDPWDPSVLSFIQFFGPYECTSSPVFMIPSPNGIVHLNVSVLEKHYNTTPDEIQCYYQAIIRKYLSTNNREDDYYAIPVQELKFGEPIDYDHIVAKCFMSNNRTLEQYMPLVKLKAEVEHKKSVLKSPSPLNVIVVGIDSVSKLNFMRRFFQTKPYLKFNMKAFDMKGFTKVGDNTFPNLIPMLTGHFVNYFWNESIKDDYFFDDMPLIWKEYAKYGHRTFFADDAPYNGIFNYLKRGFLEPPTDYYYRPLALALEQSNLRKKGRETNSACLNSELETDIMYDYLINFVRTMGKRPYFAFCMTSTLTHDFFDAAGFADAPAFKLLKTLDDEGVLNSSALVIFSDHGIRYGEIRQTYIGKYEERMPFMYVHFPKWFLAQHPEFETNLAINQDRLITPFDIHATFNHLLHLNEGLKKETDELGLSLLNEIPSNRTCADAHIQEHYCPCNTFNQVSVDNVEVLMVSVALVNHINTLLLPFKEVCETLELDEIKDARLGLPNETVLTLQEEEDLLINKTRVIGEAPPTLGDYLITLSVKPGGAIFEGTVRYDVKNAISKVYGVSRINMYGTQSWCIDSQSLKLFCFCKHQKAQKETN